MVTKNKNNFYKQYPHLKPPEPKKEGLLKKAWGWLKKAAGKVWDWTKDKAGKVWNWVKEKGSQLLDIMSEVGSKVVAWFVEKGKDIIEGAKQFSEPSLKSVGRKSSSGQRNVQPAASKHNH